MAYKQTGFPMIKGVKMHKSALKEHMGIPKDKDPEGWSMYHTADGKPRPTEHVKQIVKLMNEGMSAKEAISAVGKRGSEIKEDDQSPAKLFGKEFGTSNPKKENKDSFEEGQRRSRMRINKEKELTTKRAGTFAGRIAKDALASSKTKKGLEVYKKQNKQSPTKHGKRVTPVKHGRGRKGHVN